MKVSTVGDLRQYIAGMSDDTRIDCVEWMHIDDHYAVHSCSAIEVKNRRLVFCASANEVDVLKAFGINVSASGDMAQA